MEGELAELKTEYDALVRELVEVGNRLGANAGIMPFVKPTPNQEKDHKRYCEILDRLVELQRRLISG